MSTNHTPGPWHQGRTLSTEQTRRWTKDEFASNEARERRMVFSNFSATDQGRSRQLVAVFEREEDARLGAAAPDLLAALRTLQSMGIGREAYAICTAAIAAATGEQT